MRPLNKPQAFDPAAGASQDALSGPKRLPKSNASGRPIWRSLSARLFFIALIWVALFLIGSSIIFAQLFSDYLTDALDDRLEQYAEALIGAAQVGSAGEVNFERPLGEQSFVVPYSGYYWQVGAQGKAPLRSRSLWDQVLEIDYSAEQTKAALSLRPGPDGQTLRVLERDVFLPGAQTSYRFVVTGNFDEVRASLSKFNGTLFLAMGLLGLGLVAVVAIQITYGLRPLRRLRIAVMNIRSAKAERIPDDLPPEVMPLVGEMNALLEQSEQTVDRAKTQAGNLAHALKTPLSILTNEASVTQSQLSATVDKQVTLMRRHIDHNLARARAATHYGRAHMTADAATAAQAIVRVISKLHRDTKVTFTNTMSGQAQVFCGQQDLEEILGNVIENAAKFGGSIVDVSLRSGEDRQGPYVEIVTQDNGPGIAEGERDEIFARGKRLDESIPGTGLGLSIVSDLLDVHGGSITLEKSSRLGGLQAVVRLKRA